MVHLYAERVVFDAPTFGACAAQSLGDPRVSSYAAERIVDEAVTQRRDLVGYRPLLVGAARAIVGSEAFRAGFRHAAQGAHAALFSQSAERVALAVPDLGVLVRQRALARPRARLADPAEPARLRRGPAERALRARAPEPDAAQPPFPPPGAARDRQRLAAAVPGHSTPARPPAGAAARRRHARERRAGALLPAPARAHRAHGLARAPGAAAGSGGRLRRLHRRAARLGAGARRNGRGAGRRGLLVREPRRDRGDRRTAVDAAARSPRAASGASSCAPRCCSRAGCSPRCARRRRCRR